MSRMLMSQWGCLWLFRSVVVGQFVQGVNARGWGLVLFGLVDEWLSLARLEGACNCWSKRPWLATSRAGMLQNE